ncbi:unnamed protein product [Amaranthus hypochondriacus]
MKHCIEIKSFDIHINIVLKARIPPDFQPYFLGYMKSTKKRWNSMAVKIYDPINNSSSTSPKLEIRGETFPCPNSISIRIGSESIEGRRRKGTTIEAHKNAFVGRVGKYRNRHTTTDKALRDRERAN